MLDNQQKEKETTMEEEKKEVVEVPAEMVPVESSQIKSIGYDTATCTLYVEFKNWKAPTAGGSVYQYDGIVPQMHECLMRAESKGKYFGQQIKQYPEKFPFKKIRDNEPVAPPVQP